MLNARFKDSLRTVRIRGGVIALLGLPVFVAALIALGSFRWYQVLFCGVGIVAMFSGIMLFAHENFGNNRFVSKKRGPPSTRSVGALREECLTYNFPYTICLYHRKVVSDTLYADDDDRWQLDECALCNPLLDYIRVVDDDDLSLALTSLGDDA